MKLIKKTIFLSLISFSLLCTSTAAVDACKCSSKNCNYSDSVFSKYLTEKASTVDNYVKLGQTRAKNNSHSIYFQVGSDNQFSGGIMVKVEGIDKNSGARVNCTLDNKCNKVSSVVVFGSENTNSEYQIYNNVYEKGFRICDLSIGIRNIGDLGNSSSKKASGWWSPDYCSGYGTVNNIARPSTDYPPCP